jgi:hypothetical protein
MKTELYIGPLIERSGRFAYDTFSLDEGRRSSFRYPRIEQARHDRRAMIAELQQDPRIEIRECETLSDFESHVATAMREASGETSQGTPEE